jgi:hypothetical protein
LKNQPGNLIKGKMDDIEVEKQKRLLFSNHNIEKRNKTYQINIVNKELVFQNDEKGQKIIK